MLTTFVFEDNKTERFFLLNHSCWVLKYCRITNSTMPTFPSYPLILFNSKQMCLNIFLLYLKINIVAISECYCQNSAQRKKRARGYYKRDLDRFSVTYPKRHLTAVGNSCTLKSTGSLIISEIIFKKSNIWINLPTVCA